ncbi:hypothetical protein ABPG72_019630 [Tetrahymena utriculariae]
MTSTLACRTLRYSFSTVIFNGNKTAKKILSSLSKEIDWFQKQTNLSRQPGLGIILVGNNPASLSYIKKKLQACEAIGIKPELYHFSEDIQEYDILSAIDSLNRKDDIDAIIAQLPLPPHIDKNNVINMISSEKDADGLKLNSNDLHPKANILPCTPAACLKILEEHQISLEDKHVVLIGRGRLVGQPLEQLLSKLSPASITTCVKETGDIKQHILKADVVIAAAGERQLIKGQWIKKGAIVLDAGVNKGIPEIDPSKVVGDVEFEEAKKRASLITPVPGGIGPMTVSMLMRNTVQIWKQRRVQEQQNLELNLQQQTSNFENDSFGLQINNKFPPECSIYNYLYI